MKSITIKSTASLVFQLVMLGACSSENLQSTGLEPGSGDGTQQPSNTPAAAPPSNSPATMTPAMQEPAAGQGGAGSENGPDVVLPGDLDPAQQMTNTPAAMPGEPVAPEDEMEAPVAMPVPLTPAQVGGDLEGFLHLAPCESQDFGHDCTLPLCQGGSKTLEQTLRLGGDPGKVYDLTVHVYGIVEPRVYQGGVRRAGANFDINGRDGWHEGGVVPANPGTYNSYEMHISPPVPGAANTYFLNSRTGGDQQIVIRIDYEAKFPVQGGGTIQWRSFDLNCRQITNCATNECGQLTPKPLTLPTVSGANPPPPATFVQPYQTGANVGRGQWVYFDVVAAVERP